MGSVAQSVDNITLSTRQYHDANQCIEIFPSYYQDCHIQHDPWSWLSCRLCIWWNWNREEWIRDKRKLWRFWLWIVWCNQKPSSLVSLHHLPLDYSTYISFCLGPRLSFPDRAFCLRLDTPFLGFSVFIISNTKGIRPPYLFTHIIFVPCLRFGFSPCSLYNLGLLSHHSLILGLSLRLLPGVFLNCFPLLTLLIFHIVLYHAM